MIGATINDDEVLKLTSLSTGGIIEYGNKKVTVRFTLKPKGTLGYLEKGTFGMLREIYGEPVIILWNKKEEE